MAYALETSRTRQMLEANEIKLLRKIVSKTKIDTIRSQQIRESCGIAFDFRLFAVKTIFMIWARRTSGRP